MERPGYYNGGMIPVPKKLTIKQRLALLNHPIFTGRCPLCEQSIRGGDWHCPHCDWRWEQRR